MCSLVAVVGFFGAIAVAPFSISNASADQELAATFNERIHQQFVPVDVEAPIVDVSVSVPERLPDPEPEPEVKPQTAVSAALAAPPRYTGGGSPAEWMAAAGIPESDWGYVDSIISRESGWNPNATNASSGACGLAQALPCTKVPGGNGYDPVANLAWANSYAHTCVPSRMYCGWAGAHAFWQANHWW